MKLQNNAERYKKQSLDDDDLYILCIVHYYSDNDNVFSTSCCQTSIREHLQSID